MSFFHRSKIKYRLVFLLFFLVFGLMVSYSVFRQYYFPYFDTYEYMYIAKRILGGQEVRFYDKGYFYFIKELQWMLNVSDYFVLKFTHLFFSLSILSALIIFIKPKTSTLSILLICVNTIIFWRLTLSLRENPYFFCFICFQGLLLKFPWKKESFLLGAIFVPGIYFGHVLAGVFSLGFFVLGLIRFNFVNFSFKISKYYYIPLFFLICFSLPLLISTFNGVRRQAIYGQEGQYSIDEYGFFGLRPGFYITLNGNINNSISSGELLLILFLFLNSSKNLVFISIAPTFFVFLLGYIPFLGFSQNRVIIYLIVAFGFAASYGLNKKSSTLYEIFTYVFITIYGISNMSPLLFTAYNAINESNILETKLFLASLTPNDRIVCGRASCKAILFLDPSFDSRVLNLFENFNRRNFNQLNGLVAGSVDFENQDLILSEEDFVRLNEKMLNGEMVGVNKGIFFRDDGNMHKEEIRIIDPTRKKFIYTKS